MTETTVSADSVISDQEFLYRDDSEGDWKSWYLDTELGRLSVVDRLTGFTHTWSGEFRRDIETGFRNSEGFWLATGDFDIRVKGQGLTVREAVDLVKKNSIFDPSI